LALFGGILINVAILIASLLVVDKASDLTIKNAVKVADMAGFEKTTVGFILVAFCTSLSALSVSIFAAITESIGVAVGNALGSNIVNICLVLGVCLVLVFTRIPIRQNFLLSWLRRRLGTCILAFL